MSMASHTAAAVALAAAAALLLLSPLASAAEHVIVATDTQVRDPRYEPREVTAAPGDTVRVRNTGSDRHTLTLTSPSIDIDVPVGQEGSFEVPAAAGDYKFYCRYHASAAAELGQGMVGMLHVRAGGAPAKPAPLGLEVAFAALALGAFAVRKRKA